MKQLKALMTKSSGVNSYVLLPTRGLRSDDLRKVDPADTKFSNALTARAPLLPERAVSKRKPALTIVHSSHEDGAKLVDMGDAELTALRVSNPGVKAVPVVYYDIARERRLTVETAAKVAATAVSVAITVKFIDASTKAPKKGATVVAFSNLASRTGAQGITNAKGMVSLKFGTSSKQLDALVVYGPPGYWGLFQRNLKIKSGGEFLLSPVDLSVPDYAATLYGALPTNAGAAVAVGVIDTGVDGNHPDLQVAGGAAFVAAESDAGGWGPAAKEGEHGTHVAGIIVSRGASPQGKRGVAPGVTLHSYRVFPNGGGGASNYDILRAIERGVADGCDLLNLSLGGRSPDDAVHEAIKGAFDKGTVCIVAAGNDGRLPVSYPAAWPEAVAVSAAGKKGTYPAASTEVLDEAAPFASTDTRVFIAQFSNVGAQIDLTGPGVGIVSTLPGGRYGVMSGTSMACPAITGAAAALLGAKPAVLAMPRDRARSTAILGVLNAAAVPLGFAKDLEGLGLLP